MQTFTVKTHMETERDEEEEYCNLEEDAVVVPNLELEPEQENLEAKRGEQQEDSPQTDDEEPVKSELDPDDCATDTPAFRQIMKSSIDISTKELAMTEQLSTEPSDFHAMVKSTAQLLAAEDFRKLLAH